MLPNIYKYYILLSLSFFLEVKFILIFLSMKKILSLCQKPIKEEKNSYETLLQLKKAIEIVDKNIPWKTKCLDKALVGKFLLNHFHIPSELCIGIKENSQSFEAHAWLKSNFIIITGQIPEMTFKTLKTF